MSSYVGFFASTLMGDKEALILDYFKSESERKLSPLWHSCISWLVVSGEQKNIRGKMMVFSLSLCFSVSPLSWPSAVLAAVWADAGGGNSIHNYRGWLWPSRHQMRWQKVNPWPEWKWMLVFHMFKSTVNHKRLKKKNYSILYSIYPPAALKSGEA